MGPRAQSVVCQQSQMSQLDMSQLGTLTHHPADHHHRGGSYLTTWQKNDRLTRDFLGLTGDHHGGNGNIIGNVAGNGGVNVSVNMREMLTYTGGVGLQQFSERPLGFGFTQPHVSETWGDC